MLANIGSDGVDTRSSIRTNTFSGFIDTSVIAAGDD
jgi:hypothetical protein